MNIEIANRLLQLRKMNGLSQEDLANKLNISRQAISKWERAEASPDTDNLIELARLYGITLDELITGGKAEQPDTAQETPTQLNEDEQTTSAPTGNVGFGGGIHVRSAEGDRIDVGRHGVHIEDKNGEKVHVGFDGVRINGISDKDPSEGQSYQWHDSQSERKKYRALYSFPFPLIAIVVFLILGVMSSWAYSWIVLLTIPLYYTGIAAVQCRNPHIFCYPVITVMIYAVLGFFLHLWHPGWIVFVTIPFYYWIAEMMRVKLKNGNN